MKKLKCIAKAKINCHTEPNFWVIEYTSKHVGIIIVTTHNSFEDESDGLLLLASIIMHGLWESTDKLFFSITTVWG